MLEAKQVVVQDEVVNDYMHVMAQWQEQKYGHVLVLGQQEEVKEELPVAKQGVQVDFDTGEMEVQDDVQEAVQYDSGWGCSESIGHVRSVGPGPDVIQRYLEGCGP